MGENMLQRAGARTRARGTCAFLSPARSEGQPVTLDNHSWSTSSTFPGLQLLQL